MKNRILKLLCLLGIHKWEYYTIHSYSDRRRKCSRCFKRQYVYYCNRNSIEKWV